MSETPDNAKTTNSPDVSDSTDTSEAAAAAFFVRLLHSSTQVHLLHLKSRSYAQHMALGAFYEALPGLVDKLIESWQGVNGLIETYPSLTISPADDPLAFVKAFLVYVAETRECVGEETEFQNIVDEILTLGESTLYKLRFLS